MEILFEEGSDVLRFMSYNFDQCSITDSITNLIGVTNFQMKRLFEWEELPIEEQ